jgi:hypothetical protein
MNLRNDLIKHIEVGLFNKNVMTSLIDNGYNEDDIVKELKDEYPDSEEKGANTKELFLEYALNKLRDKIEWNNKFYKDTNVHDIISHLGHINDAYIKYSNENYHLKKYIEKLELTKGNLQIKLELCRHCSNCIECKDISCVNNIWYK